MRQSALITGWFCSWLFLSSPGLGRPLSPHANDITQLVVATIYRGDISKTKEMIEELGDKYQIFLQHFSNDAYCKINRTIAAGCEAVKKSEAELIRVHRWRE